MVEKGDGADGNSSLNWKEIVLLAASAVISFQLAYFFSALSSLILVYLFCLFQLTRLRSGRHAFYTGLSIGFLACAPQLTCFWSIFHAAAIPLWIMLAFWTAMFVTLGRLCRVHFGKRYAALLIPFIWTGLEYFRSELYYLRFSWLNAGYVFSDNLPWVPLKYLGVYGMGFFLMGLISLTSLFNSKGRILAGTLILAALGVLTNLPPLKSSYINIPPGNLQVAGVQLEFPSESVVISCLDKLIKKYPEAQLLALSEYTFDGPVPEKVKAWCREHQRHLIIGAKDPVSNSQFFDTAFVIGPTGEIIFRQAKSVPIQFFKDGLPATEQKLWESPWGKIGICICYDLSYSRVTDQLIRLGAQAIIVPTMDIVDWGRHQHELHARVAPIRAAEYGVPIFRLASSGISQCVHQTGEVLESAPFPGDEAMISGSLDLKNPGKLPLDRIIAPLSVCVTGIVIIWLVFATFSKNQKQPFRT
ncbi:MAG: Apolipoprotein N-acyltransferase-like protein [Pedosphaera sp.]|nr:Apolipoprotein N-acyltransferase-like protein [Pedosphaera sp.]